MTTRRLTTAGRMAGAALALGLLACSCTGQSQRGTTGTGAAGREATSGNVVALNQMSTLRALFNRANGYVRLVLIFSPT